MTREPSKSYRQQQAHAWTRVDMLIALYGAGIRNVEQLIDAARDSDDALTATCRTKAVRVIVELLAGLDHSYGELPQRLTQLFEFMQHALLTGELADFRAVRDSLVTLRDGFVEIRDPAAQLEEVGAIAPMQHSTTFKFMA